MALYFAETPFLDYSKLFANYTLSRPSNFCLARLYVTGFQMHVHLYVVEINKLQNRLEALLNSHQLQ